MDQTFSNPKRKIALLILFSWLTSTAIAFWWFQIKDLRQFDLNMSEQLEERSLSQQLQLYLSQLAEQPSRGFIINFWQPDCNCNRFNIDHIQTLKNQYEPQGFKLITIASHSQQYGDDELKTMGQKLFSSPVVLVAPELFSGSRRIPAAPAAAIVNLQADLAYFGPYNDGAFCGVGGTKFVEKVADLMLTDNTTPNMINTLSYGCYCNWS